MTKGKRYWVVKLEKLANGQDLADVELVAMHRLREKARRSSLLRRTFGHDPFIVRVPIFAALAGISLLLLWPVVDRIAAPFGGFFGSMFWGFAVATPLVFLRACLEALVGSVKFQFQRYLNER